MANAIASSFSEIDVTATNASIQAEWTNNDGHELQFSLDWRMMDLQAERNGLFVTGMFCSWFCFKQLEHTPYLMMNHSFPIIIVCNQ